MNQPDRQAEDFLWPVAETMNETGRDLNRIYRETAEGGLAKLYK